MPQTPIATGSAVYRTFSCAILWAAVATAIISPLAVQRGRTAEENAAATQRSLNRACVAVASWERDGRVSFRSLDSSISTEVRVSAAEWASLNAVERAEAQCEVAAIVWFGVRSNSYQIRDETGDNFACGSDRR
jgi:hypothetical protein